MVIEKIKILGAVLELPAKQHCQFSPFGPTSEVNGLDWQCCLAGGSKMAPRILIFSIAIGADYSYDVKNGEIWAPTFLKHNNSFIATVYFRFHLNTLCMLLLLIGYKWFCVFLSQDTYNISRYILLRSNTNTLVYLQDFFRS